MNRTVKYLVIGLGVLIIGSILAMKATSTPQFCASCHRISVAVTAWEQFSHNQVDCLDCHADPGVYGYVKRKIYGLHELYVHLFGEYPERLEAKVNIENCILCHTGKVKKHPDAPNLLSEDVKMNHSQFLEEKVSCLQCHREVAHGDLTQN